MDRPKVLVAGGTGYLGKYVIQALHRAGYPVRALARSEARLADVRSQCAEVFVGEATRPEMLAGLCDGVGVVVSSLGKHDFLRRPTVWDVDHRANMNILARAEEAGVGHFVFVSVVQGDRLAALGVDIALARESAVDALKSSGIPWTVLRPTGFFNDMEQAFEMARGGTGWVIGDGGMAMNPIHGADLADEVVRVVSDPSTRGKEISQGGPDVFTTRQSFELAFEVLGKPPRIRSVPSWVVRAAVPLVRLYNPMIAGVMHSLCHMRKLDVRAPAVGTHHLRDFFVELARKGPSTAGGGAA